MKKSELTRATADKLRIDTNNCLLFAFIRVLSRLLSVVLLCLLSQLPALAADPVIRANLSVATTTVEQPVELQIEIQNARVIDPPDVAGDHLGVEKAGHTTRHPLAYGPTSFS